MTPKPSIAHRMKSALLGWATGRLLPRVVLAATAATAAAVMQGYGKLADSIPGLADVVDPQLVVDLSAQFVVAFVLLALSRWTGKPVREWQERLRDEGVYAGRRDGWIGPRTDAALLKAINSRTVFIAPARPVDPKLP